MNNRNINSYDSVIRAVYDEMNDSDVPYERAKRMMTMTYINARSYAIAAIEAYTMGNHERG